MDDRQRGGTRRKRTAEVEDAVDGFLETFRANGVDYFFSSPGTEFAPFWEHFAADTAGPFPTSDHGIGYVGCRHEEVAVQMAMGYTITTGVPQVVGLHVNVGSLHAAMSIHGAARSRVPMVIVSSHVDTHEGELPGGTAGSHYLHFNAPGGFEDYFSRYLKWVAHPERSENATRYLARALRVAGSTPTGPVLVNLARELIYDETATDRDIVREATPGPSTPSEDVIDEVASELHAAENPVIVSGRYGRTKTASDRLVALAERLHAPVIENPKWYHGMPVEHPLSLGDRAFASHYLDMEVDSVLVIDSECPWYPPAGNAPDGATVIAVSPDPAQTQLDYWNYPIDRLLGGDPAATVATLLERLPERSPGGPVDWEAEHEALRDAWDDLATAGRDDVPIDPFWLCRTLDRRLPDDAVIVEETTVHKEVINNLIETKDRRYISAGKALAGGRGGGLGIALGAKLADPKRPVVALVGDGGYHYNPVSAALGAAQQHELPFLTVVFDNGGYRSQESNHLRKYPDGRAAGDGRSPGGVLSPRPSYEHQAAAWDAHGETVTEPSAIPDALDRALDELDGGRAAVLDVVVKPESPRESMEPPT